MSTTKIMQNKRRNHAEKVLQQMSKNLAPDNLIAPEKVGLDVGKESPEMELKNQYEVIMNDVMKLRDDLTHGYALARNYVMNLKPEAVVKDLLKAAKFV